MTSAKAVSPSPPQKCASAVALAWNLTSKPPSLFTEVNGCLLVEVSPANASAFENQFANLPFTKLARLRNDPILKLADANPLQYPLTNLSTPSTHPDLTYETKSHSSSKPTAPIAILM